MEGKKSKVREIFEKYRFESGTIDLSEADQLPIIVELEQELDKAREEGIGIGLNAVRTEVDNLHKRLINEQLSKLKDNK